MFEHSYNSWEFDLLFQCWWAYLFINHKGYGVLFQFDSLRIFNQESQVKIFSFPLEWGSYHGLHQTERSTQWNFYFLCWAASLLTQLLYLWTKLCRGYRSFHLIDHSWFLMILWIKPIQQKRDSCRLTYQFLWKFQKFAH